ncbi:MAG: hypothetical protein GX592_00175 [Clostridiales bacterium]|nr:hypothetical protein [Clostridiales bacterium]
MRENSRTRTMLCELIIVVLFLALSSLTLFRLFSAASALSRESEASTYGTLLAQDALERLVAGEDVADVEHYAHNGREYSVSAEADAEPSPAGTLYRYRVRVAVEDATVVSVETANYRPERSAQ